MPDWVAAWVGLGGNVGDTRQVMRQAVRRLAGDPGLRILGKSSLYRTAPWGREEQADFINAVVRIASRLGAHDLLEVLKELESDLGRRRDSTDSRWGPRVIDLDLLLYGDVVVREPSLQVPHPRMHERAFVLGPLAEISPGIIIPGRGQVEHLLDQVGDQRVERLDAVRW